MWSVNVNSLRIILTLFYKVTFEAKNLNISPVFLSPSGLNPLHLAVRRDGERSLRLLVEGGAKINAADQKSGNTALHLAVRENLFKVACTLITEVRRSLTSLFCTCFNRTLQDWFSFSLKFLKNWISIYYIFHTSVAGHKETVCRSDVRSLLRSAVSYIPSSLPRRSQSDVSSLFLLLASSNIATFSFMYILYLSKTQLGRTEPTDTEPVQ